MTGRNDLLEAELTTAIASAEAEGHGNDAAVARLWTMLGLVQHNTQNVLKARNTLRHAVEMLTATLGEQREAGCALVLLGRSESVLTHYEFLKCAMHFYHHVGQMVYLQRQLCNSS
jgi:hypothetical protein